MLLSSSPPPAVLASSPLPPSSASSSLLVSRTPTPRPPVRPRRSRTPSRPPSPPCPTRTASSRPTSGRRPSSSGVPWTSTPTRCGTSASKRFRLADVEGVDGGHAAFTTSCLIGFARLKTEVMSLWSLHGRLVRAFGLGLGRCSFNSGI